jgi:hypothetical protein
MLTKRVMSEVLPTLCSPRNTSLNFLSGEEATYSPPAGDGGAADMRGKDRGGRGGEREMKVDGDFKSALADQ